MGIDSADDIHATYSNVIKIVPLDSADEFLNELRITNVERWGPGLTCPWLFRGHRDSTWTLRPPAWREDVRTSPYKQLLDRFESEIGAEWDRKQKDRSQIDFRAIVDLAAQLQAVNDFGSLCNAVGLYIPDDWFFDSDGYVDRVQTISEIKSHFKFPTQAMAFAQHHGIPTMLLDWTLDPLVAAYFATREPGCRSDSNEQPPDRIAVWALDLATLKGLRHRHIKKFAVHHHGFEFIHAQDGVFTYYDKAYNDFERDRKWPCLEDVIQRVMASHVVDPPVLVKLTLPNREVSKLSDLLYKEKRNRAYMFPTYDNVSETVARYWGGAEAVDDKHDDQSG